MFSKLKKRLNDRLFVLAIITLGFWIANTYLKIFILHAPERMLWYSSSGLALITIGLFTRNSFLLTAMFCALAIPESIWSVSFLSKLFFNADISGMVTPVFDPSFPFYQFVISIYHITIVPSLVVGLTSIRRVHSFGWLGAFVFAITLGILSQTFSDPSENINCVLQEVGGSCKLFFSYFYQFDNSFLRIILVGSIITLLVYLPLNYGLLVLAKRLGWQKIDDATAVSRIIKHVAETMPTYFNNFAFKVNLLSGMKLKIRYLFIVGSLLVFILYVFYSQENNLQNQLQTSQLKVPQAQTFESKALYVKEQCNKSISKESCYSKEFSNIAFENGDGYAFGVLFELQKHDPDALKCHFIAHGIGWGSYKRDPEDARNQIGSINPGCAYGASMGIIELYAREFNGRLSDKNILTTVCSASAPPTCSHIIGHMLLVETEGDIDTAVEPCQEFDKAQRDFCLIGVFMEHVSALNLVAHGYANKSWYNLTARIDDIEKLCRTYDSDIASACWGAISQAAVTKFNKDPEKVFNFCDKSHVKDGIKRCKNRAIYILATLDNFDLNSIKHMCTIKQTDDPDFEKDCYMRLIEIKLLVVPASKATNLIDFCSSIDEKFESHCFQKIGRMLQVLKSTTQINSTGILNFCKSAPEEFRSHCIGSNVQNTELINEIDLNNTLA